MKKTLLMVGLVVMCAASSGCSYHLKRTVVPPTGMKFRDTAEGKAWGYDDLLALRQAEVRARKLMDGKQVAQTIEEAVNCNYRGLYFVPGVNIIAAFFPLCHAEIKLAVFDGGPGGAAVVREQADVGVTTAPSTQGTYWIRVGQCKANRCSPCPSWPTKDDCEGLEHACRELQGVAPACGAGQ